MRRDTKWVLVAGGSGQIGQALAAWPLAFPWIAPGRHEMDITDVSSIRRFMTDKWPAAIINLAAYTAVDAAEDDVAAAFRVNALGPASLADISRERDIPLIHLSTDYVFSGAGDGWHGEDAPPSPQGVYGASKRAGELAVLSGAPRSLVLRTAWVVSPYGRNFLKTILALAAKQPLLTVVDDQWGCPTSALDIAGTLGTIVEHLLDGRAEASGIYHFVNSGDASWFDLASRVITRAGLDAKVQRTRSTAYPTRAHRPINSRLATTRISTDFGIQPRPWEDAIDEIVDALCIKGENS